MKKKGWKSGMCRRAPRCRYVIVCGISWLYRKDEIWGLTVQAVNVMSGGKGCGRRKTRWWLKKRRGVKVDHKAHRKGTLCLIELIGQVEFQSMTGMESGLPRGSSNRSLVWTETMKQIPIVMMVTKKRMTIKPIHMPNVNHGEQSKLSSNTWPLNPCTWKLCNVIEAAVVCAASSVPVTVNSISEQLNENRSRE